MLEKFEVEGYRNFKNRTAIDFSKKGKFKFNGDCIHDNILSKVLVYGKNGNGKTNYGHALTDISSVLSEKSSSFEYADFMLNAQSDLPYAEFYYRFNFDSDILEYRYRRDESNRIIYEWLQVNGKNIFETSKGQLTEHHLDNLDLQDLNTDLYQITSEEELDAEWIPFLRWIIGYSSTSKNGILQKLFRFIRNMKFYRLTDSIDKYPSLISRSAARISRLNPESLQNFLQTMGFECSLIVREDEAGQQKLYFNFGEKSIPFYENASSGIKSLAEFYQRINPLLENASFLYLDEFDAFFHYDMARRFYKYMTHNYPEAQIIFTTHNTDLMNNRDSRPDCIMILSQENGFTPLFQATKRELREGHNLEKMYQSGEFGEKE